jgi:hypothetical protein
MAFVSEGQVDSSQARSAWVAMQRARPGGTVEVVVSPRDICPRNRALMGLKPPAESSSAVIGQILSPDLPANVQTT